MCNPGTFFAALSTVATAAGTFMQMRGEQRSAGYDAQWYEIQRRQQEDAAKAEELRMMAELNDRKEQALRDLKSNKASLAGTNIDLGSPSFGAFLASNRETERRDLSNIKLMGTERQTAALLGAQQSSLAAQSVRARAKSSRTASLLGGVADATGTLSQVDWDSITS